MPERIRGGMWSGRAPRATGPRYVVTERCAGGEVFEKILELKRRGDREAASELRKFAHCTSGPLGSRRRTPLSWASRCSRPSSTFTRSSLIGQQLRMQTILEWISRKRGKHGVSQPIVEADRPPGHQSREFPPRRADHPLEGRKNIALYFELTRSRKAKLSK